MAAATHVKKIGTGVTWDVDQIVTDEIYMDLGVGELTDEIDENLDPGKGLQEQRSNSKNNKNVAGVKQAVIHTTPSPGALRASAINHIHNGQNCSCKRRILASVDDNADPDPFSFLSDEIILSIFCWLSKITLSHCAKVCRRWRQLAYDDDLWRRVDLSSRNFQPGILGMILQRGVVAAKLSRSTISGPVFADDREDDCMDDNQKIMQTKLSRWSLVRPFQLHLDSLDLSACITNDPCNIQRIVEQCPALKRLSLESCVLNSSTLQAIATCGDSLQVLNLAMCRLTSDAAPLPMLSSTQQLTSLNLSWINIGGTALHQLIPHLSPNLHLLNLSGYRDKLKDEDVIALTTRCPKLHELDLSDSTILTANCVGGIIHNTVQLEHLSLSRCYDIPQHGFGSLAEMQSLRALDVFGVMQDRQLERLKVQLPRVQLNAFPFSSIARPTFSSKLPHHIWGTECEV